MIRVTELSKSFVTKKAQPGLGGFLKPKLVTTFQAVKNLSLSIDKGEFVAFLGPNGAGKTTTLKMLTGILFPTSGKIDVFGFNPFEKKNEFKKMISFVMAQKTQLFLELPVKDTFDFIAEVYQVDKQTYKTDLHELVSRFELEDKLETIGRRLSLGQRMKCELIASFIPKPKVIFLDEPTIGLDVNSSQEVRKFLKETNKQEETTIILTTHNMQDVEELCDRTIVINKGEKIYDGRTEELKRIFGDTRAVEFYFEDKKNNINVVEELKNKFEVDIITNSSTQLICKSSRSQSTAIINYIMNNKEVIEINILETDLSQIIAKLYKE